MTTETHSPQKKVRGVIGILFGVLLYYLWVAGIIAMLFTFFTEPSGMGVFTVKFPHAVQTWLVTGTLPFFIISGHYLFCRGTGENDLLYDLAGGAGALLGFLLWLTVLGVMEVLGVAVPYFTNLVGGFLLIAVLSVIFWRAWRPGA